MHFSTSLTKKSI